MLRGLLMAIPGAGPVLTAISFVPPVVWKYVGIVAIAASIFMAGDIRGARIEREKCEAAARAAQVAANKQDEQAHSEVQKQDTQITTQLIEQKKVDDAAIESLKAELAKRPAGAKCEYDKSNADPSVPSDQRRRVRQPAR